MLPSGGGCLERYELLLVFEGLGQKMSTSLDVVTEYSSSSISFWLSALDRWMWVYARRWCAPCRRCCGGKRQHRFENENGSLVNSYTWQQSAARSKILQLQRTVLLYNSSSAVSLAVCCALLAACKLYGGLTRPCLFHDSYSLPTRLFMLVWCVFVSHVLHVGLPRHPQIHVLSCTSININSSFRNSRRADVALKGGARNGLVLSKYYY